MFHASPERRRDVRPANGRHITPHSRQWTSVKDYIVPYEEAQLQACHFRRDGSTLLHLIGLQSYLARLAFRVVDCDGDSFVQHARQSKLFSVSCRQAHLFTEGMRPVKLNIDVTEDEGHA